jgi:hypothetical protein
MFFDGKIFPNFLIVRSGQPPLLIPWGSPSVKPAILDFGKKVIAKRVIRLNDFFEKG